VCAGDGGEEEGAGGGGDFGVEAGVDGEHEGTFGITEDTGC
jgi:hypothetical protein